MKFPYHSCPHFPRSHMPFMDNHCYQVFTYPSRVSLYISEEIQHISNTGLHFLLFEFNQYNKYFYINSWRASSVFFFFYSCTHSCRAFHYIDILKFIFNPLMLTIQTISTLAITDNGAKKSLVLHTYTSISVGKI